MKTNRARHESSLGKFFFLLLLVLIVILADANPVQAAPTFQAAGTAVGGAGAVTPTWPAHATDDIALLFIESRGEQAVTLSSNVAGFALVANSPQFTGTTTSGTRLTVFWTRATSASMPNPTVADPGDHVMAQILTYRGVVNTGNPWDVTGGGVKTVASTAVSASGVTTTVPDTLIVVGVAQGFDASSTTTFSGWANSNLTGISERADYARNNGDGGGFGVMDGVMATAGATGNTTATMTNSFVNAFLTIALKAPPAVTSINLADTNPTNASSVSWTVTFNRSVTGVDATDFALVQAGGLSGASISSVSGSGTVWTVTANTGSSSGTLGLNLVDDDSIVDSGSVPLGGSGAGNGNFTGQVYTVDKTPVVINTYYPGTVSVAVGATSITLGAATGATTPIAAGDVLIIMQMQDASIDSTNTDTYGDGVAGDPGSGATSPGNSGLYEYAVAANAVPLGGGTLGLACGTINAYTNANAVAGTSGQHKFQVIRVPVYASYTLAPLTAQAWNGSSGGVVALDVTGALTLNSATVTADGLGFRGGAARGTTSGSGTYTDYRTPVTNLANGTKGEGIAGTPYYVLTPPGTATSTGVDGYPNGSFARGAPGNAGGGGTDRDPAANDQNSGGGGGGNAGTGGIGGIGWCPTFSTTPPYYGCGYAALVSAVNSNGSSGGFGGAAITGLGATRITLGGGGGSGTTNNSTGTYGAASSSGAAGGGIIMIRAGSMTGSATFTANGSDGDSSIQNDGSGGGGGGGAVLVQAGSGMAGVTVSVKGGIGGSNLIGSTGVTPHGPGGGGGGGYAITSGATAACNVSGGANGVTYNNGALFGAYGSTPGSGGSCDTSLTATQIPGSGVGGVPACPSSVNHYAISHSGNGVNCQAEPVTFTAHNAAHATVTLSSAKTITLSTSTGKGDWSLVTGLGTLNNGAANDGIATYQFGAESSVILALKHTTPGSVNINVTDGTATETTGTALASEDQNLVFAPSGFRFTDGTNPVIIGTQISGKESNLAPGAQSLYLQAIRTDTQTGACVGVFASGTTVNVDMASQCNNPTSCVAGQNVRITNNSITTALASNPNSGVGSYTSVPLLFGANSQAPFTFNYTDAGQISLYAHYVIPLGSGGASPDTMVGSSGAFVVRPFGFRISGPPSGRTGGSSAVFTTAGQNFNTTLTAVAWQSADDTNNDGVPDSQGVLSDNSATPNFGLETMPASASLTHALAEPSGGANGTLSGSTTYSGFTSGTRTQSVNFSEVGIIRLLATTTNYLGGGQDVTAGINTEGLKGVGRFIPAYFDVTSVTPGCNSAFTYAGLMPVGPQPSIPGQPFNVTVRARNTGGLMTQNYDKVFGFSKDTTISNAGTATNFTNNVLLGSADYTNGFGTDSTITYRFATKETAPQTLTLRAVDIDGVSSAGHAEPTTIVRSGRMHILNAYGSELANLPVPMRAEYYYDAIMGWITNPDDGCTAVGSVTPANPITVVGSSPTKTTNASIANAPMAAGDAGLQLSAPMAGGNGYVDLTASPNGWLLYDWNASGSAGNPTGRATFGLYRGSPRSIYLRERY